MTTPAELAALPSARPYPPANAAQAGNAQPGVQPGSSQFIIAQYVVVFGANGGVFIYSGTPARGNPPVYSISNATQDPYDNPVSPGIWAGPPGSIQVGIQANPGSAEVFFTPAGNYAADAAAGIVQTATQAILEVLGAQTTPAGAGSDRVGLLYYDHGTGSGSAEMQAVYFYQGTTGFINLFVGNFAGLQVPLCAGITAVQPGTGTDPDTLAVPETWHALAMNTGWGGSGSGVNGLFYRISPENGSVEVELDVINSTATGNSVIGTLPTGYRPSSPFNRPLGWNNPQASNSATVPWLNVSTGGVLTITGIETANREIFGRAKFYLGTL